MDCEEALLRTAEAPWRIAFVAFVAFAGLGAGVLESGTHRLSRRAASHAESWLPGRPGSRVAGNRGEGERLKRGGGRGLAEWTLIVHRGSNSSVPASLANLYFFATESASQTMLC